MIIRRKLAAFDPSNAEWQRDVSVSLTNVGNMRLGAGDRAGALAAFEGSLSLTRKLAAIDASNARWQIDLATCLYHFDAVVDPPRVRAALREALAILEALARANRLTAAQKNWLQFIRDALAKLPPERADAL